MRSFLRVVPVLAVIVLIPACSKQDIPTATVLEAEMLDEDVASIEVEPTDTPIFLAWEEPPRPTKRVMPEYPKEALQDGTEGKVILNIVVDEKGVVLEVSVVTANPPGVFDDSAITAMKQWEFEPAESRGQPIKVRLAYPIEFTLTERER